MILQTDNLHFDQALIPNDNLAHLTSKSPSLTDFLDFLKSPSPPPSSGIKDRQKCSESCYGPIHNMAHEFACIVDDPGGTSLDKIMQLFDLAATHAAKYLACPSCDAGCVRHINLGVLLQRQVNVLGNVAENPAVHVGNDATRVSFKLGEYRASKEDDIMLKRMLLLRVIRGLSTSVLEFNSQARGYEERHLGGTLELGEAGKLNLKWLLDIAESLTRRLDCIKFILEKDDWALHLAK